MPASTRIHRFLRRNVLGLVAIYIALGGAAYAGVTANSVGTKHLQRGAVTPPKIAGKAVKTPKIAGGAVKTPKLAGSAVNSAKVADGSLTGVDILNGSLGTADLANAAVTNAKLGNGAVSNPKLAGNAVTSAKVADSSLTGADILNGSLGTADLAGGAVTSSKLGAINVVADEFEVTANGGVTSVSATCPPGRVLISGGAAIEGTQTMIRQSFKLGNSWRAGARNNDAVSRTLSVQAYCLTP